MNDVQRFKVVIDNYRKYCCNCEKQLVIGKECYGLTDELSLAMLNTNYYYWKDTPGFCPTYKFYKKET